MDKHPIAPTMTLRLPQHILFEFKLIIIKQLMAKLVFNRKIAILFHYLPNPDLIPNQI